MSKLTVKKGFEEIEWTQAAEEKAAPVFLSKGNLAAVHLLFDKMPKSSAIGRVYCRVYGTHPAKAELVWCYKKGHQPEKQYSPLTSMLKPTSAIHQSMINFPVKGGFDYAMDKVVRLCVMRAMEELVNPMGQCQVTFLPLTETVTVLAKHTLPAFRIRFVQLTAKGKKNA